MNIRIEDLQQTITEWMEEYHKYTTKSKNMDNIDDKNYYYTVAGMYHTCAVDLHNKLVLSGDMKAMKVIMECTD